MFDILVYLFENYLPEACPEPSVLARKLSAVGFEEEAINEALDWLAGLQDADSESSDTPDYDRARPSIRIYVEEEQAQLTTECRGFLTFLEQAGALPPVLRELVVERAMALSDSLSLARLKVIVLMVMWRHQHSLDTLLLEELLAADDEDEGEDRLCH